MAIKVGGTTIIDNSRNISNLEGFSGSFGDFRPEHSDLGNITGTATLDFSGARVSKATMTGNTTFSESNKIIGRDKVLYIDTSASGYTPTFSSNVEFPNGTPTWSGYRHWVISFICWGNTVVRATALGFTDAGTAQTNVPQQFQLDSNFQTFNFFSNSNYAECWASVDFERDDANNRIKIGAWSGDSSAMSSTQYTYLNYTGLTGIDASTGVQVQYNVQSQACSGSECNANQYSFGPTPTSDGYNSGTYYNLSSSGYIRFGWAALALNLNDQTNVSGNMQSANPDLRIKIVANEGTFYSTCEMGNIALSAQRANQSSK